MNRDPWVLWSRLPKSPIAWYWCGGGNPRFQNPEEATKYGTYGEVKGARDALREEGLGTFEIERLSVARQRFRRRMFRRTKRAA